MKVFISFCISLLASEMLCFSQNKYSNNDWAASYPLLTMPVAPFQVEDDYLLKHDIVYKSPTQLALEGFPMGNGNMGGMIWNHDNGIELQINKNDLWTVPEQTATRDPETGISILKHAARVKIDFGAPVFSWIHDGDFTGRLSLKNGEVSYRAHTAFSSTEINTWLAAGKNIWVLECNNIPAKTIADGNLTSTISLERIGSRAFPGWYGGNFSKDISTGMGKTDVSKTGNTIVLKETGMGLNFVVACRVVDSQNNPQVISSHRADIKTDASQFVVLIAVVSRKESASPEQSAIALLDEAEQNRDALKNQKEEWYRRFWSNSFVKLGNDYLENIYYLRRYLMAAGSQGQYPVAFNGGLWRWNHDVMNWVTPHHWNTEQQYFGLCAQNDAQLMKPYLNTYFKMLPQAEALAKERGASNAILIAEGHDFDGRQVLKDREDMDKDYTPASQIALLFWDYYDFTGNKKFLQDTAYLFMKKAAQFYVEKLQWDNQKKEYYLLSSLYESADIDEVRNAISDRDCIEALFTRCIRAAEILHVDADKIKKWRYILDHLWKRGFVEDKDCGEMIAPAEEYFTKGRYTPFVWASGGSIVFPSGVLGMDQKESRLGKAVADMVKCKQDVNAHYPTPIIAARLGMGNEALTYLLNGINIHQIYPQGLMSNVTGYPDKVYDLNSIHDLLEGRHKIRSQDFFQAGMEPISNYATTVNEMMLQSNEGKIRVFPAIPQEWNNQPLAFILLARGAFLVSSECVQSHIQQIGIKSLQGNTCKVENPWPGKKIIVLDGNRNKVNGVKLDEEVISFSTKKNESYIILQEGTTPVENRNIYTASPNQAPKLFRNRILGKQSGWNEGFK